MEDLELLGKVEEEMRKGNKLIQEINNKPADPAYDEKILKVREQVAKNIRIIFYNHLM